MNFCHVTLTVKDLDASVRFYQDVVGLPINKRYPAGPGVEIAFLGGGDTLVELICRKTDSEPALIEAGNGVSIGFEAESLEDMIALLREKGYDTDGKIISPSPGVSFFFTKDPDGFTVQFIKR